MSQDPGDGPSEPVLIGSAARLQHQGNATRNDTGRGEEAEGTPAGEGNAGGEAALAGVSAAASSKAQAPQEGQRKDARRVLAKRTTEKRTLKICAPDLLPERGTVQRRKRVKQQREELETKVYSSLRARLCQ